MEEDEKLTVTVSFEGAALQELKLVCDDLMRNPENLIMWAVREVAKQVMEHHRVDQQRYPTVESLLGIS